MPLLRGSATLEFSYELVHVGELCVPTGKVLLCDPFLANETGPVDRGVPVGRYPVTLCVVDLPDWGKRVALAGMVLSDHVVRSWVRATHQGQQTTPCSTFEVRSGLACFMDEETAGTFSNIVSDYQGPGATRNYYDDILAPEFKRNADPAAPYRAGDWDMHVPAGGGLGNVAMFASGLGDGDHAGCWGLDQSGQPAVLVADFGILPGDSSEPAAAGLRE